jgi:hypothetical protein
MHVVIAALWVAAYAACPYSDGTQFWSNDYFLSQYWAPFMVQEDVSDNTFDQQVQSTCDATYVMCPSINEANMEILYLHARCTEKCKQLYILANTTSKEDHHVAILERFANQLDPPDNGVTEDQRLQYQAANAHIAGLYGDTIFNNNAKYFTFNSSLSTASTTLMKRLDKPSYRFTGAGPEVDLRKYVRDMELVSLHDDPYMLNWVNFFAYAMGLKETESEQEKGFTSFKLRTLVSYSLSLCWSMLLTGWETKLPASGTFVPNVSPPPQTTYASAQLWSNKCGKSCGSTPVSIPASQKCNYQPGKTPPIAMLANCKKNCLADSRCVGIYWGQTDLASNDNAHYVTNYYPSNAELFQEDGAGYFNTFLALSRHESSAGLRFHREATSALLTEKLPSISNFRLAPNASQEQVDPSSVYTLDRCTDNPASQKCLVFKTNGTYIAYKDSNEPGTPNATAVRTYLRVTSDTAGHCEAYCMNDGFCLAWTWDEDGCKLDRSIGGAGSFGFAPNLDALTALGLDPSHGCADADHAFDLCSGTCVNIHSNLEMGWCNHPWVLCQAGPFKDTAAVSGEDVAFNQSDRLCVGGSMPAGLGTTKIADQDQSTGYEKYRFTPENTLCEKTSTFSTGMGTACYQAHIENRVGMTVLATQGGAKLTGTYRATKCGTVGAGPPAKTPAQWTEWLKYNVGPQVSSSASSQEYMSALTLNYTLPAMQTNTYVTSSSGMQLQNGETTLTSSMSSSTSGIHGRRNPNSENAYFTGDCAFGGKKRACLFPTCMLETPTRVSLYQAIDPTASSDVCVGTPAATTTESELKTALEQLSVFPPSTCVAGCQRTEDNTAYKYVSNEISFWNGAFTYTTQTVNTCNGDWPNINSDAKYIPTVALAEGITKGWNALTGKHHKCTKSVKVYSPQMVTCAHGLCLSLTDHSATDPNGVTWTDKLGSCVEQVQTSFTCTRPVNIPGYGEVTVEFAQPGKETLFRPDKALVHVAPIQCRTGQNSLTHACDNQFGNYDIVISKLSGQANENAAAKSLLLPICNKDFKRLGSHFLDGLIPLTLKQTYADLMTSAVSSTELVQAQLNRRADVGHPFITYYPNTVSTTTPVSANPSSDDIQPEGHYAEYANTNTKSTLLPTGITNAVNQGLMCPVGIVVPKETNYVPTTANDVDTSDFIEHPYAQLTAKCPPSKPYRCSHMTMQQPAGGTCEYGYNWSPDDTNAPELLFTSGAGSFRAQMETKLNTLFSSASTPWEQIDIMEQVEKNAQCHLYDFGCYTAVQAQQYSVCGIATGTDTATAASAGLLCGKNPVNTGNALDEGFCGIKVDNTGTSDGVPKHIIVPVSLQEAYEGCTTPPNTEPVCPIGFVLQWLSTGKGALATCLPIMKAAKPASRVDTEILKPFMMPKVSKIKPVDNPYIVSVLCTTDSVWNDNIGCVPIKCEHRATKPYCIAPVLQAPADKSYPQNICMWDSTANSCKVNPLYAKIQIDGVNSISTETKFSKFYWPGFQRVTNKPSFAGVGPAYAYSATSCGTHSRNCQGFAYCDNPASTDNLCLESAAMVAQCCKTPLGTKGTADTFTQYTRQYCEISPSTMCAGGSHLFVQNDMFTQDTCGKEFQTADFLSVARNDGTRQTCACCKQSCNAQTQFISTQTDFVVEANSKVGPSVTLKELYGVLVDTTDTSNPTTVNANSCLGADNRLQGASWNGKDTACACRNDPDTVILASALTLPYYKTKPSRSKLDVSSYCNEKQNVGTCVATDGENSMYQTTPPGRYSCDFEAAEIEGPEIPYSLIHTDVNYTTWTNTTNYAQTNPEQDAGAVSGTSYITNQYNAPVCMKGSVYANEIDKNGILQGCGPVLGSCPELYPYAYEGGNKCCNWTPDNGGNTCTGHAFTVHAQNTGCTHASCGELCCKALHNQTCPKNHCFRQFPYNYNTGITSGECKAPLIVNVSTVIARLPAKAKLFKDAQKPTFCDPSESCAYTTRVRTALDAFVPVNFGINATATVAQLLTYNRNSYRVFRTMDEVNNNCISRGTSCIGYATLKPPSSRPVEVMFLTPENQVGQSQRQPLPPKPPYEPGLEQVKATFVYKRTTTEHRPHWIDFNSTAFDNSKYTYTRALAMEEAIIPSNIVNYCAAMEDCSSVLWSDYEFVLAFDVTSAHKTGLGYNFTLPNAFSGLQKVPIVGVCPFYAPYAYDKDGIIGSGCCSSADISSTGTYTNYILDHCPGIPSKCGSKPSPCKNYLGASTCPAHVPCVHGKSLLDPTGTSCKCFCNGEFTGSDCSVCSRKNALAPDCTTCKPNFVEEDELCVCKNGWDISSVPACTTCLPFFKGEDCRTNTCRYYLGEGSTARSQPHRPGKVEYKNAVLAEGPSGMLYDGIYAAGDGTLPHTMRHSFALQDKQLYWLGMHDGVAKKQRVQNTAVCKHWNDAWWLKDGYSELPQFGFGDAGSLTSNSTVNDKAACAQHCKDTPNCVAAAYLPEPTMVLETYGGCSDGTVVAPLSGYTQETCAAKCLASSACNFAQYSSVSGCYLYSGTLKPADNAGWKCYVKTQGVCYPKDMVDFQTKVAVLPSHMLVTAVMPYTSEAQCVDGTYLKDCDSMYVCNKGRILPIMDRPAVGTQRQWDSNTQASSYASGTVLHTCKNAGYAISSIAAGALNARTCYGQTLGANFLVGAAQLALATPAPIPICEVWNNAAYFITKTQPACTNGRYYKNANSISWCDGTTPVWLIQRVTCNPVTAHCPTVLEFCTQNGYTAVRGPSGDFYLKLTGSKEPDLHSITHYLSGGWLDTLPLYGLAPVTFNDLTRNNLTRGAVCVQTEDRTTALKYFLTAKLTHDNKLCQTTGNPGWTCTETLHTAELDYYDQTCADSCAEKGQELCAMFVSQKVPAVTTPSIWCFHFTKALVQDPNFPSSVYNVQPEECTSGGMYGTGEWRNNPNKPEFSVPKYNETLTPVDPALQNTLVCAWEALGNDTAYFLSEYRRHVWASTTCSSRTVNRIDSNWLMSLPRGKPMDKTHARAAPGGTVRAFNRAAQGSLTAHGQQVTNTSDAAACGLLCGDGCDYWYYGSSASETWENGAAGTAWTTTTDNAAWKDGTGSTDVAAGQCVAGTVFTQGINSNLDYPGCPAGHWCCKRKPPVTNVCILSPYVPVVPGSTGMQYLDVESWGGSAIAAVNASGWSPHFSCKGEADGIRFQSGPTINRTPQYGMKGGALGGYVYTSQAEANHTCVQNGYSRLCTKAEVIGNSQRYGVVGQRICGITSDKPAASGYWMSDCLKWVEEFDLGPVLTGPGSYCGRISKLEATANVWNVCGPPNTAHTKAAWCCGGPEGVKEYSACFDGQAYPQTAYQIDDALIMKSLDIEYHPYLRLPNRFALKLDDPHFAENGQPSAAGCCKTCSDLGRSVCHYDAGMCRCYDPMTLAQSGKQTVDLCWAPTKYNPDTQACNAEVHFGVFPGQKPNSGLTAMTNPVTVHTAQACKSICLNEPRCLAATLDIDLLCTLHTYTGGGDPTSELYTVNLYTVNPVWYNLTTFTKRGGCRSIQSGDIDNYCQYDMHAPLLQGARRTDYSSANGATFAFATDVNLYYGTSSAAATVQAGADSSCTLGSTAFVAHGMHAGTGAGLTVPDVAFISYLADSVKTGGPDVRRQVLGAPLLGTNAQSPTFAKRTQQSFSNSISTFTIPANNDLTTEFKVTQSYAFPASPGITPASCQRQADLASALVGESAGQAATECLIEPSSLASTSLLPTKCTPADLSSTGSFDRVRTMYLDQARVCMQQLGQQPDPLYNVPFIFYIQPPYGSGYSAYMYQGLPIYAPNDPYDVSKGLDVGISGMQLFGSTELRAQVDGETPTPRPTPEPLPTPPPSFPYSGKKGINGTLTTGGGSTYGHCTYTKFKRTIVQIDTTDALLFQFDHATYEKYTTNATDLIQCAELCNTFLLCRLVTFIGHCNMYGATFTGQNLENAVVSETNDGCRLLDSFFSLAVTTPDLGNVARMAVKDDCCLARFPVDYEVPTPPPTPSPTAAPTASPTAAPTAAPTLAPTLAPTAAPTAAPTLAPTAAPTLAPTAAPTLAPTAAPTLAPTAASTLAPTAAPTAAPTLAPTAASTLAPTAAPTAAPTLAPTIAPTVTPV